MTENKMIEINKTIMDFVNWDENSMLDRQQRIPYIRSMLISEVQKLLMERIDLKSKMDKIARDKFIYYSTQYNRKLSAKEINDVYIPQDEDYSQLCEKVSILEEYVKILDRHIDNLKDMGFSISTRMKFIQFQNGN